MDDSVRLVQLPLGTWLLAIIALARSVGDALVGLQTEKRVELCDFQAGPVTETSGRWIP
jgi:hypothetical protein